jgi:hypothetical protein
MAISVSVQMANRRRSSPRPNPLPEPKLLGPSSVPALSSRHILVDPANGDIKVQPKAQDRSRKEHDENRKGSVLEVCRLNFHRAELDSPSDGTAGWGWLETEGLPVGRLERFKVIRGFGVIEFDCFGEHDQWITDEKMGDMFGKEIVDI